ncbi:MAG: hypothetical protein EAZ89_19540 [Bacteroidetes bacterium]|nr:MAG: hypothetical protein EAZ89_19540 [Bacteroidota bacterium]
MFFSLRIFAQTTEIDTALANSFSLFGPDEALRLDLSFNYKQLIKDKYKDEYQEASLTVYLNDSTPVTETIRIKARGNFRRSYCSFPPLMLNFKQADFHPKDLQDLEKLKLVTLCRNQSSYQQYIFSEYLSYKLYNILTPLSFRVRLVHINLIDLTGKVETQAQYGFLIEEVEDVAARAACFELKPEYVPVSQLDRQQTTLMAVFEYMIGNTDWNISNRHNVRILKPTDPNDTRIYPVPYDFDYSGLVNAYYAIPDPLLGIESVRQRMFVLCRRQEDLFPVITQFIEKEAEIRRVYEKFPLIDERTRREALAYLDEFYKNIRIPSIVKQEMADRCTK